MNFLQPRLKAVVATVLGFLSPLVTFYSVNQNLTLKELVAGLVSAVVTGGLVHQVPNKKVR